MKFTKKMPFVIILLLLISTQSLHAGHKEGNGGDHIRGTFLKIGEAVLSYLNNSEGGKILVSKYSLNLELLTIALDINKIEVSDRELVDNGGAVVDALGVRNKIMLNRNSWMELFDDQRDVYYLVFHEILRSAGYNDDNYRISGNLNPFPISLRISTRINPLTLLIDGDLSKLFPVLSLDMLGGSHCGLENSKNKMELDLEKNILDISTPELTLIGGASLNSWNDSTRSCTLNIPVQLPFNKKLTITQVDISGKVSIPMGSSASLIFEIDHHGKIQSYKKTTFAKYDKLFGRVQLRISEPYETRCGERTNLDLRTILQLKAPGRNVGYTNISGIRFYFRLDDCSFLLTPTKQN